MTCRSDIAYPPKAVVALVRDVAPGACGIAGITSANYAGGPSPDPAAEYQEAVATPGIRRCLALKGLIESPIVRMSAGRRPASPLGPGVAGGLFSLRLHRALWHACALSKSQP